MSEPAAVEPASPGAKTVSWELVVPEAELELIGYGMRMPNDFTLERLAILQQCKRILGGPPADLSAFGIAPMEHLLLLYDSSQPRLKTYGDVEALVLAAETESPPVALPFFEVIGDTDRVTQRITRSSTSAGVQMDFAFAAQPKQASSAIL
jgi:hypothetical protein